MGWRLGGKHGNIAILRQCFAVQVDFINTTRALVGHEETALAHRQIVEDGERGALWQQHEAAKLQAARSSRLADINESQNERAGNHREPGNSPKCSLERRFEY